MTEEKLEKAKLLLEIIKSLKVQRSRWENAISIYRIEVASRDDEFRSRSTETVDAGFINFEELKALAMMRIDKRLEEVQLEFDNL